MPPISRTLNSGTAILTSKVRSKCGNNSKAILNRDERENPQGLKYALFFLFIKISAQMFFLPTGTFPYREERQIGDTYNWIGLLCINDNYIVNVIKGNLRHKKGFPSIKQQVEYKYEQKQLTSLDNNPGDDNVCL